VVLETHPEITERIRRVAAIVTTDVNDPHGAATDLGDVLPLRDTEALGHELEGSPIGKDVAEKEDEEAVRERSCLASRATTSVPVDHAGFG
jgi:hypothetical protein